MIDGVFRRRHLPHWDVGGHAFFVTACLAGSISAAGLRSIQTKRLELEARERPAEMTETEWEHHCGKLLFAFVDRLLDYLSPVRHLADDRQAEIVRNAFLHFAGERYRLFAFVVMPSHHHWLFLPNEDWENLALQKSAAPKSRRTPREIISHSIQSYTATMCNRIRGETGTYWQGETFDHWVRDDAELLRIIEYIEGNPVAAGLTDRPENWPWSSAPLRLATGIMPGQPLVETPR
jgi:REP element-mobilizing transposase RayT